MKNKRHNSDKSNLPLESKNDDQLSDHKRGLLPDGSYIFEVNFESKGFINPTIITCSAWLLEIYKIESGDIFLLQGEKEIRPKTKHIGIFYPPFSITRLCFKNAEAFLIGIAGTEPLPSKFTLAPIIFDTAFNSSPSGASQAIELLDSGENLKSIETNPKASLLSLKAKKLIDENYLIYPSTARVASRLNVTHAHLSRQFKNDFGMSPSDYLRQLRMADAPLKFARGEKIINVSNESGYNDLSRFYKQFRKTTQTSPGACQTIMKPVRN